MKGNHMSPKAKIVILAAVLSASCLPFTAGCENKTNTPNKSGTGTSTMDKLKENADKAKEKGNEAAKDVKDKTGEAVDKAKQMAEDAKTAVVDGAQKQYDNARSA